MEQLMAPDDWAAEAFTMVLCSDIIQAQREENKFKATT